MSSWAARLGSTPEVTASTAKEISQLEPVAVLDANAIISLGAAAASLAPVLASTDEVVAEIKDASARAALSMLSITLRAPTDDAIRAVASFAARTGDLHQLSTEDIRLIALAYTYEQELYGTDHLRTEPVPVRAQGGKTAAQRLPGWGATDAGWEAIDKIPYGDASTVITKSTAWSSACTTPSSKQTAPEDSWGVARSSKNAERRAKRKAARRRQGMDVLLPATAAGTADLDNDAATDHFRGNAPQQPADVEPESSADEEHDEGEAGAGAEGCDAEESTEQDDEATTEPAHHSLISLVTSDFAMQNVAIQMGLRLVSKGGAEITSLQRSVLRCEGCSNVCKSQSKVFCPACGHATLSKVSVTVGPDGSEHIGVRKRFTLRGTRYSLPKPRGGCRSGNPILSEDVYKKLVRVPRKPTVAATAAAGAVDLDDLRFGELKKHAAQSRNTVKGLYHLSTGARNNPNERKNMSRSNRRR